MEQDLQVVPLDCGRLLAVCELPAFLKNQISVVTRRYLSGDCLVIVVVDVADREKAVQEI